MKGQEGIIEFMLNIGISFMLILYVYFWGLNIFYQQIDFVAIHSAERSIRAIDNAIRSVVKFGGKQTIEVNIQGSLLFIESTGGELFNCIEARANLLKAQYSSVWLGVNTANISKVVDNPLETQSVIEKRAYGKAYVFRLFYRIFLYGSTGTCIILKSGNKKSCNGYCEITVEDVGEKRVNFSGRVLKCAVIKVEIK